jgi:hypothetical protein
MRINTYLTNLGHRRPLQGYRVEEEDENEEDEEEEEEFATEVSEIAPRGQQVVTSRRLGGRGPVVQTPRKVE